MASPCFVIPNVFTLRICCFLLVIPNGFRREESAVSVPHLTTAGSLLNLERETVLNFDLCFCA
jgi:hypothetical protein